MEDALYLEMRWLFERCKGGLTDTDITRRNLSKKGGVKRYKMGPTFDQSACKEENLSEIENRVVDFVVKNEADRHRWCAIDDKERCKMVDKEMERIVEMKSMKKRMKNDRNRKEFQKCRHSLIAPIV